MIVDDSAIIRGLISRWIEAEPDMTVVGSVRTGLDAVNQVERVKPDVVVLDIEMPDMDGIEALPLLLAKKRDLIIIMASTLTRRNAEISLRALSLGASDYIPKPESTRESGAAEIFKRDLILKVRQFGAGLNRAASPVLPSPALPRSASYILSQTLPAPVKFTLRPFSPNMPRVLLIGSSTGGPQALMSLTARLGPVIDRVPVLITQHMPPTFTTILAEHLARVANRPVREAVQGEAIKAGRVYLAPGGLHMRVARQGDANVIALDDGPQINFCRPAVDPLFMSAIGIWRNEILALILTGMGSDGMRGGKDIVAAGGNIIAQDEATSVVWGMPGSAANAGICTAVLPLDQIAQRVLKIFSGEHA
ncbi:MAG: chemotaxis response regulator protein-glutamate methylesterase [Bradyrhizobiaceae bacterium]|nr:MAG: chemotaxis response regulator protein-glutamate methylesterase [Bradyrhizobiaceae bacterium]